jgi:hypothetical protein
MNDVHEQCPSDDAIALFEQAIKRAGNIVQPSDDLRPRTIEAAREYCSDRRLVRSATLISLAIAMTFVFVSPALDRMVIRYSRFISPSAAEMEQLAVQHAAEHGGSLDWSLSESFDELRRVQAERLKFFRQ